MRKPHQEGQNESFFFTEDVATEMAAAGCEFKPPSHARTKSVRDVLGLRFGEMLEEAIRSHLGKAELASIFESRGEGV